VLLVAPPSLLFKFLAAVRHVLRKTGNQIVERWHVGDYSWDEDEYGLLTVGLRRSFSAKISCIRAGWYLLIM